MESKHKQVYIKDRGGDTFLTGVFAYKDDVIRCASVFTSMQRILKDVENFVPKQEDVWILAYPKCGTHWLCEIVGILTSGKLQPLKQHKECMMVEAVKSLSDIENAPSPRIINSHLHVRFLPKAVLEKSKIICVVRNPKSAAVSYFHHCKNFSTVFEYKGNFENFMSLYYEGLDDVTGNWFQYHQTAWDLLRERGHVYFVVYEDMIKDPVKEIKKISEFLDLERDDNFIREVTEISSFSNMSESIGKDLESFWHKLTRGPDGKSIVYRKGKIDDWKNHFTVGQNEEFDKYYEEKMKDYPELKARIKFE